MKRLRRFLADEDGPTTVEYAVLLALILVSSISILKSLGESTRGTFTRVNEPLAS